MELIPKEKIEQEAKDNCEYNPDWMRQHDEFAINQFKYGTQFDISELEPVFCEFADFAKEYGWKHFRHDDKKPIPTKQLFEIFIKERNNDSTRPV